MGYDALDLWSEFCEWVFKKEAVLKVFVTGSLGLCGSAAVRYYLNEACEVIGVDNDMRKHFFGEEASVARNKIDHSNYTHLGCDMASKEVEAVFQNWKPDVIIHAGAQTSAEWSLKNTLTDFGINAYATLMLLEMTKKHIPESLFIYLSVADDSEYSPMKISKLSGELYVKCYEACFGLRTGIFKCLRVTGKNDVMRDEMLKSEKHLIHASDLASAIYCFSKEPGFGAVYKFSSLGGMMTFGQIYQNWRNRYNRWAILEDLKG